MQCVISLVQALIAGSAASAQPALTSVLSMSLVTLSKLVWLNEETSRHAALHVPSLLSLVGKGFYAEEFISSLLENNRTLLESLVDDKLVALFLDLVRGQGGARDARFLRFFATMCSCKDSSVVSNQLRIGSHALAGIGSGDTGILLACSLSQGTPGLDVNIGSSVINYPRDTKVKQLL